MSIRPLDSYSRRKRGYVVLGIAGSALGPSFDIVLACSIRCSTEETGIAEQFPIVRHLITHSKRGIEDRALEVEIRSIEERRAGIGSSDVGTEIETERETVLAVYGEGRDKTDIVGDKKILSSCCRIIVIQSLELDRYIADLQYHTETQDGIVVLTQHIIGVGEAIEWEAIGNLHGSSRFKNRVSNND